MLPESDKNEGITLDVLAGMVKAGFDAVDERFDEVDKRFDNLRSELTEKIDTVDASLRVEIGALRQETRDGFIGVNNRLADIGDKFENHEERVAKIEHELVP